MWFFAVGFEVGFEKTQRVDPRATAFANARALLGLAHRNFFKHGGD
jgi:hypothetical protein